MAEEAKCLKRTWGGARPNTGGARPGAGRKKLEGDAVTKSVQFRHRRTGCNRQEVC